MSNNMAKKTNKQWFSETLKKVEAIEDYRIAQKHLTGQLLIDSNVAKNMLLRNLKKSYKKVTDSKQRVKTMAHINRLYLLMEKDKVKNVLN